VLDNSKAINESDECQFADLDYERTCEGGI
jgi:hypothetical protein